MSTSENTQEIVFDESSVSEVDSNSYLPTTHGIEIRGDVRTPGEFTYKQEADIFHYLNLAGGAFSDPKLCNIIVVRQYGDKKRSLLFRLDQKDYLPRIKRGDLIIITDLGDGKNSVRQFHKPAISSPASNNIIRTVATEHEKSLPGHEQALKRAISDYIKFPQFKRLLNQIASHQAATGAKSIAIMSCERGEGKSFFCSALALAYARFLDSQVLILDSNRNEAERSQHLTVVKGDYSTQVPKKELHSQPAFVDLCSVSEIESDYHENIDFYFSPYIKSVQSRYDLILVDTCAISAVHKAAVDPMIISSQVDGVIVINTQASLDKRGLEKLDKDLRTSGARVIGTVYNSFFQK